MFNICFIFIFSTFPLPLSVSLSLSCPFALCRVLFCLLFISAVKSIFMNHLFWTNKAKLVGSAQLVAVISIDSFVGIENVWCQSALRGKRYYFMFPTDSVCDHADGISRLDDHCICGKLEFVQRVELINYRNERLNATEIFSFFSLPHLKWITDKHS